MRAAVGRAKSPAKKDMITAPLHGITVPYGDRRFRWGRPVSPPHQGLVLSPAAASTPCWIHEIKDILADETVFELLQTFYATMEDAQKSAE